jgi:predicted small lipoprotein YifL
MGPRLDRFSTALLAVLVAVAALAGCAGKGPPAADAAHGDAGGATSAPVSAVGGAGAGGDGNPASAPAWQVGQWWRWRLESAASPAPLEALTAVVSADAGSYSIGAPDAPAAAQVYPFHLVALGPVARGTLAWQAHGVPVQFLRFPLVDGDSWTADFWSAPGATVTVRNATVPGPDGPEPGYRSEATYSGGGVFAAASWSPARGQFVQVQTFFGGDAPFATATLVAQGQGEAGAKPFIPTDLLRLSSNPTAPASLAPADVQVPDGAAFVLMACFLGGGPGQFAAAFDYRSPPVTQCTFTGMDDALRYSAVTVDAAGGSGHLAVAPAGQGGVTVELFAVATA